MLKKVLQGQWDGSVGKRTSLMTWVWFPELPKQVRRLEAGRLRLLWWNWRRRKEINTVSSPGPEVRSESTASAPWEERSDSWKLSSGHVCTHPGTQRKEGRREGGGGERECPKYLDQRQGNISMKEDKEHGDWMYRKEKQKESGKKRGNQRLKTLRGYSAWVRAERKGKINHEEIENA